MTDTCSTGAKREAMALPSRHAVDGGVKGEQTTRGGVNLVPRSFACSCSVLLGSIAEKMKNPPQNLLK